MSEFTHVEGVPHDFAGVARLFPLPNLVMFPGVMQPLHIFEPRYVEMLEDALAGDQLIAVALLTPGWEQDYQGAPSIARTVCLGRITAHSPTDDGRHNLLLAGLTRARVLEELPTSSAFREARVALAEDKYPGSSSASRNVLRRRLLAAYHAMLPDGSALQEHFDQLLAEDIDLGAITDLIAYTIAFSMEFKQQLLDTMDVDERALALLAEMPAVHENEQGFRPYPIEFSMN